RRDRSRDVRAAASDSRARRPVSASRVRVVSDTSDRDALRAVLGDLMPPSHARRLGHAERIELDTERKLRTRNKISYRINHWPIWIWTFFIAPGPLTFDLFAQGVDWRMGVWLAVVIVGTGIAGLFGKLPGVEPAPYIIRFT